MHRYDDEGRWRDGGPCPAHYPFWHCLVEQPLLNAVRKRWQSKRPSRVAGVLKSLFTLIISIHEGCAAAGRAEAFFEAPAEPDFADLVDDFFAGAIVAVIDYLFAKREGYYTGREGIEQGDRTL